MPAFSFESRGFLGVTGNSAYKVTQPHNKMQIMKNETQKETSKAFTALLNAASLSELKALDIRLARHYNAGTLTVADYGRLTVKVMVRAARLECGLIK